MTLDYYCASVRARVKKCLSQNRAKSLTKATRAVDTAESSKPCGSFEAIFSTSMAPLMDGDKVATIAEEVDSSTLTLTADRGEAEVSSFSKMAKIKRRRREIRESVFPKVLMRLIVSSSSFPTRVGEIEKFTYSPSKSGIASQINSGHACRGEQFSSSWRKSDS